MSEERAKSFARSILPLYHDSFVTILIKSSDHEYKVSKEILCRESTYFSASFESEFEEGQQQKAILEEIEGIVSVQSLEAFLQWIYLHEIEFDLDQPEDQISAAIELARFADMCNVTTMESTIALYLKERMLENPNPEEKNGRTVLTYSLTSEHIISATSLPRGHEIRRILATAAVAEYLKFKDHRFAREMIELPSFGADLLQEVGFTLEGLKMTNYGATYQDPLTGDVIKFSSFRAY